MSLSVGNIIALQKIGFTNLTLNKFFEKKIKYKEVINLTDQELQYYLKPGKNMDRVIRNIEEVDFFESRASELIEFCKKEKIKILSKFDKSFPKIFKELDGYRAPKCPPVIYVKGENLSLLKERKNIAVVGTRKASKEGFGFAKELSLRFSDIGFNIVSGLALGIDTAGHEGALSSKNKKTIAMMVDVNDVYPPENLKLSREIIKNGGLLVAENPPQSRTMGYFFTNRNRFQTISSLGVFPVESSLKSGTTTTVKHAQEQGRSVFCPSSDSGCPESDLTRSLIAKGHAESFSLDDIDEIAKKIEKEKKVNLRTENTFDF